MNFTSTRLAGVHLVESVPSTDARGFFARTYCEQEFAACDLNTRWVQQNHTRTLGEGSVRGLHFQAEPNPEIKLVRCLAGEVWDVVVDVRPESPTFGQWEAVTLSAENMLALYIPAGFAHGFQSLTEQCDLFYLMSDFYHPELARGVRWDDPDLAIAWPKAVSNLSARDQQLPTLADLRAV